MPKLTGATLLYPHVSLPWGEKSEKGENEQVSTLFKTFPPSMTQDVERAKSAIYKSFVNLRARKFPPVRGCWALPNALVPRAERSFEYAALRFWTAVDEMGSVYDMLRAVAQTNLGGQFKGSDYPEWADLRASIRCTLVAFTVDESDTAPASAMSFTDLIGGFRRECYNTLCTEFSTLLSGMVLRLTEGKKFYASKMEEFGQFLSDFSDLASLISGDPAEADIAPLKVLVEDAKTALAGTTPEDFKDDKGLRGGVAASLNMVAKNLDGFMSLPVGSRRLQFTPDPE